MARSSAIDWGSEPLGAVPDYLLAQDLGVSPSTVRYHRRARGIPSCQNQRRAAEPTYHELHVMVGEATIEALDGLAARWRLDRSKTVRRALRECAWRLRGQEGA